MQYSCPIWQQYHAKSQYGNDIRIFGPVSKEDAIQAYRNWAAANGLTAK
jgi:hypothetical protein